MKHDTSTYLNISFIYYGVQRVCVCVFVGELIMLIWNMVLNMFVCVFVGELIMFIWNINVLYKFYVIDKLLDNGYSLRD